MRLVLDLPPRELSPNFRSHWAKKAKAVKYYREQAWARARIEAPRPFLEWKRATLRTTWYLPDARRRDPDNLMASLKAAIDGLVDARVLADDNGLIIHPPVLAIDRQWARVVLDIEEAA